MAMKSRCAQHASGKLRDIGNAHRVDAHRAFSDADLGHRLAVRQPRPIVAIQIEPGLGG